MTDRIASGSPRLKARPVAPGEGGECFEVGGACQSCSLTAPMTCSRGRVGLFGAGARAFVSVPGESGREESRELNQETGKSRGIAVSRDRNHRPHWPRVCSEQ